ncbi:MAG: HAD family phosphatase [Verrucomicrobia bacterium]|nr:HAD family phosphatase [Verrucomicrobiota bacterium]MBS0646527.1 HAD family phosphatase [Verrucomicrobiota bacterium]
MTSWNRYQLYLFDFDGVLADTESLHLKAYQRMCARRGCELAWDQHEYAKVALFHASGLKQALYTLFPALYQQEPSWDVLYQEKRRYYLEILEEEGTQLMPGVQDVLESLENESIPSCVVTHSPKEQIERIVRQHPILSTIRHWVTRECYHQPKPHPECYQQAMHLYAKPGDRVIGFEDSPRGMMALSQTNAKPYLVTSFLSEDQVTALSKQVPQPFVHIPSFTEFNTALV